MAHLSHLRTQRSGIRHLRLPYHGPRSPFWPSRPSVGSVTFYVHSWRAWQSFANTSVRQASRRCHCHLQQRWEQSAPNRGRPLQLPSQSPRRPSLRCPSRAWGRRRVIRRGGNSSAPAAASEEQKGGRFAARLTEHRSYFPSLPRLAHACDPSTVLTIGRAEPVRSESSTVVCVCFLAWGDASLGGEARAWMEAGSVHLILKLVRVLVPTSMKERLDLAALRALLACVQ